MLVRFWHILCVLICVSIPGALNANSNSSLDFIEAACRGDISRLTYLYSAAPDLDVNAISATSRRTALTCSVANSQIDVVKLFTKLSKIDFNKSDGKGDTWLSLGVDGSEWFFGELAKAAAPSTRFETMKIRGKSVLEWPGWYSTSGELGKSFETIQPFFDTGMFNQRDDQGLSFLDRHFKVIMDPSRFVQLRDPETSFSTTNTKVLLTLLERLDIDRSYFKANGLNLISIILENRVDRGFLTRYLEFLSKQSHLASLINFEAVSSKTGDSILLFLLQKYEQKALATLFQLFPITSQVLKIKNKKGKAFCNFVLQNKYYSDRINRMGGFTPECASQAQYLQSKYSTVAVFPESAVTKELWPSNNNLNVFDRVNNRIFFLAKDVRYDERGTLNLVAYDLSELPAKKLIEQKFFANKYNDFQRNHFWVLQNGDILLYINTSAALFYGDLKAGQFTAIRQDLDLHRSGFATFAEPRNSQLRSDDVLYYGSITSSSDTPLLLKRLTKKRFFEFSCIAPERCLFLDDEVPLTNQNIVQFNSVTQDFVDIARAPSRREIQTETKRINYTANSLQSDVVVDLVLYEEKTKKNNIVFYDRNKNAYTHSLRGLSASSRSRPKFLFGTNWSVSFVSQRNPKLPDVPQLAISDERVDGSDVFCHVPVFFGLEWESDRDMFAEGFEMLRAALDFDPKLRVAKFISGNSVVHVKCE